MGKGPTRRQGSGQKTPESVKNLKRSSREIHKDVNQNSAGPHSSPQGGKGYNRKEKHKTDHTVGEELTPVDETYRGLSFPMAETLSWAISARKGSGFSSAGDDETPVVDTPGFPPTKEGGGDAPDKGAAWGFSALALSIDDVSTARPCGEGEDPQGGHCNPNLPPEQGGQGGGSFKDQQSQMEQQMGRPMNPSEFMDAKKQWDSQNPDQAARKQQEDSLKRQETLDDYDRAKYAPPESVQPSGYNVGPQGYQDEGAPGPNRREAPNRMRSNIAADLNWSTHKSETFNDDGEDGDVSAWGLKSIIDRGVKPHEKSDGAKRIEDAENSTQKRTVPSKSFESYSMVGAFNW